MGNQPIRDERILEAIEACRPGSDDVADPALAYLADKLAVDPELADLYDRLQQVDGRLAAGFRDVSVPEGLEQRLLERLATVRVAAEDEGISGEPPVEPAAMVSPRAKRISRRWLLVGGGMVTAAAALLVAVWIGDRSLDYTPAEVWQCGIETFRADWDGKQWPDSGEWVSSPELGRYVLPRSQVQRRRVRFLDRNGLAYDMMNLAGRPATLYVVNCTVKGLNLTAPPRNPSLRTGGDSVSAWMENGQLYVLVVDGDAQTYRGFFDPPDAPLT